MKIIVEIATVNKGIVEIKGTDYIIQIDTKEKENFDYLKTKLQKYPWANECSTWGEVLKKMSGRKLDIAKKYKVA